MGHRTSHRLSRRGGLFAGTPLLFDFGGGARKERQLLIRLQRRRKIPADCDEPRFREYLAHTIMLRGGINSLAPGVHHCLANEGAAMVLLSMIYMHMHPSEFEGVCISQFFVPCFFEVSCPIPW